MAYVNEYGSGINLDSMVVPVKAATIFAAHESSLYLGGQLVPMINVPMGSASAQVPLMGSVTATTVKASVGETDPGADIASKLATNDKKTIALDLHASRTILRDLGGIDTDDMGRILGNSIATAFDKDVTDKMEGLTYQSAIGAANVLTAVEIATAVGTIRGAGDTGELFGIISSNAYGSLMSNIGSTAFAGGEFQNSAMRNGFFGSIAGVPLYVSSYLNDTTWGTVGKDPSAVIMSKDAMRAAQQGGVKIEVARRPEAVGFDIVASLAAGVEVIDSTRGVWIGQ
jgi:hypothetical protein